MQPHEAFKLGFLARCVEEGLSPAQTNSLAKTAADLLNKQAFVRETIGQVTGTGRISSPQDPQRTERKQEALG